MVAPDLLSRDQIEADGRRRTRWFEPSSSPGGRSLQHMRNVLMIEERDRGSSPIDGGVVLLEPRHAEDRIVPAQGGHGEIQTIGIRRDSDGNGVSDTIGRLVTTVGQSDGAARRRDLELASLRRETSDERRRDEVTVSAAVDEDDGGLSGNAPGKLDEDAPRSGELVNLPTNRRRRMVRAPADRTGGGEVCGRG